MMPDIVCGLIIIMLLLTLTPHMSEGCGRTSKPKTTVSPLDSLTHHHPCGRTSSKPKTTVSPLDSPTHRNPCSDEEAQRSKCLNGGECYAIYRHSAGRSAHCQCRKMFKGQRCEEISPDIFLGKVDTANAVSGVVVVITLVIVIIVFCFLRLYYRS